MIALDGLSELFPEITPEQEKILTEEINFFLEENMILLDQRVQEASAKLRLPTYPMSVLYGIVLRTTLEAAMGDHEEDTPTIN